MVDQLDLLPGTTAAPPPRKPSEPITGGDSSQPSSGIEPRPYDVAWARGLVTAGQVAPNVHVFVKQLGARPLNAPPQTDVYAGEKVEEWPEDIRVRNFPPELLR